MLLDTPLCKFGWQALDFTLNDSAGKPVNFHRYRDGSSIVVAFICNHCPYVKAIVDRLAQDAAELEKSGIKFLAVMSNDYRYVAEDSPEKMALFANKHNFVFPYLIDEDQSIGQAYGAVCTPDFFGFNTQGELQYRGRLDNIGMNGVGHRKPELLEAMQLIDKTGSGPKDQTPSMGCSIKWRNK